MLVSAYSHAEGHFNRLMRQCLWITCERIRSLWITVWIRSRANPDRTATERLRECGRISLDTDMEQGADLDRVGVREIPLAAH